MQKYMELSQKDHNYDWKMPLNFYGMVVDEQNKPVAGAAVSLQWNTVTGPLAPSGTLEKHITSDDNGLFKLLGESGKCLGIRVEKDGYYTLPQGNGWFSFEYANPSSDYYYQPNPNTPVIFHLLSKKKGVTLVSKSLKIPVDPQHLQLGVDLMSGQIIPNGSLQININNPNLSGRQPVRFPWSVKVTLTNGGFFETKDMLPFQAPDQGYVADLNFDYTNPKDPAWRGLVNQKYYFHLTGNNIFGVILIYADCDGRSVHLSYAYNPTPGDRNLEPNASSPQFNPNPY